MDGGVVSRYDHEEWQWSRSERDTSREGMTRQPAPYVRESDLERTGLATGRAFSSTSRQAIPVVTDADMVAAAGIATVAVDDLDGEDGIDEAKWDEQMVDACSAEVQS